MSNKTVYWISEYRIISSTSLANKSFTIVLLYLSVGAFFWGYSGYSYSGLGIKEYTEL